MYDLATFLFRVSFSPAFHMLQDESGNKRNLSKVRVELSIALLLDSPLWGTIILILSTSTHYCDHTNHFAPDGNKNRLSYL